MSKKDCVSHTIEDCMHCESRHLNPICAFDDAVKSIAEVRSTVRFKADQYVFYAGNSPLGLYTIESGLVKLEVISPCFYAIFAHFVFAHS
jgi:hypothetical protein